MYMWLLEKKENTHLTIREEKSVQWQRTQTWDWHLFPHIILSLRTSGNKSQSVSFIRHQSGHRKNKQKAKQNNNSTVDWYHGWFKTQLEDQMEKKKTDGKTIWYKNTWIHMRATWRPEPVERATLTLKWLKSTERWRGQTVAKSSVTL